jgi:hypothetical protein
MNALVQMEPRSEGRSLTAVAVREHVNLIQEVMQAVMKKDTHFGVIPGCDKPSLYKAGSEVLLTTFRIAVSVEVEDLSTPDCIRYRVRTIGTHQQSGTVVGEGIGECSSDEEKYKWRQTYVKKEFDATPETRRRLKFSEYKGVAKEKMQIRTEPADVANTVLKMAKKRAQIDMTLTALAASDIFTQDVEDLPEELRPQQAEPTAEEWLAIRKGLHDAALARNSESVKFVKDRLDADDGHAAYVEWMDIPEKDRDALSLAPTKGGCFTVTQRQKMNDQFQIERKAFAATPEAQAVRAANDYADHAADREILQGIPK